MTAKRKVPVTDDERKERNRQYQNTRRHKTDNEYARAYRRASQRAVRWFQENKTAMWDTWLAEERESPNGKPYQHGPKFGAGGNPHVNCDHPDSERRIVGFATQCALCGTLLGAVGLPDGEFDAINARYEV